MHLIQANLLDILFQHERSVKVTNEILFIYGTFYNCHTFPFKLAQFKCSEAVCDKWLLLVGIPLYKDRNNISQNKLW